MTANYNWYRMAYSQARLHACLLSQGKTFQMPGFDGIWPNIVQKTKCDLSRDFTL